MALVLVRYLVIQEGFGAAEVGFVVGMFLPVVVFATGLGVESTFTATGWKGALRVAAVGCGGLALGFVCGLLLGVFFRGMGPISLPLPYAWGLGAGAAAAAAAVRGQKADGRHPMLRLGAVCLVAVLAYEPALLWVIGSQRLEVYWIAWKPSDDADHLVAPHTELLSPEDLEFLKAAGVHGPIHPLTRGREGHGSDAKMFIILRSPVVEPPVVLHQPKRTTIAYVQGEDGTFLKYPFFAPVRDRTIVVQTEADTGNVSGIGELWGRGRTEWSVPWRPAWEVLPAPP